MNSLWSLLIQIILAERFYCSDSAKLLKLRLSKVVLSQHLFGASWQMELNAYPDIWFDLVYIEFDALMKIQRVTYDAGSKINRQKMRSKLEWSQLVQVVASSRASQIKIVSARKIEADYVLEYFRVQKEAKFDMKDSELDMDDALPQWLKKIRKFYRDPVLFLRDSKFKLFQYVSRLIER